MGLWSIMSKDDEWDFGFSDDLEPAIEKHQSKAQDIVDMVLPLLNNLKKNPDKPNIVWPNREKDIDKFIKRLYDKLNS
jgi:hypothetical protein